MPLTPWLHLVVVMLVAVAFAAELVLPRRAARQQVRPGWWAPPAEQERLLRILERHPSYDERTGLTSDRELARWYEENRP